MYPLSTFICLREGELGAQDQEWQTLRKTFPQVLARGQWVQGTWFFLNVTQCQVAQHTLRQVRDPRDRAQATREHMASIRKEKAPCVRVFPKALGVTEVGRDPWPNTDITQNRKLKPKREEIC